MKRLGVFGICCLLAMGAPAAGRAQDDDQADQASQTSSQGDDAQAAPSAVNEDSTAPAGADAIADPVGPDPCRTKGTIGHKYGPTHGRAVPVANRTGPLPEGDETLGDEPPAPPPPC